MGKEESNDPSEEVEEDKSEKLRAKLKKNYQLVTTKKDFNAWLKKLKAADLIAFDTETDSLDYMQANVVGLSFAVKVGEAAYVPFTHSYTGAPKQLDRDEVLKQLEPILND